MWNFPLETSGLNLWAALENSSLLSVKISSKISDSCSNLTKTSEEISVSVKRINEYGNKTLTEAAKHLNLKDCITQRLLNNVIT